MSKSGDICHKTQSMLRFICLLLFLPTAFSSMAQSELSGTLTGAENKPVSDALVFLFLSDSTLVKTEIPDEQGRFRFQVQDSASYFIRVESGDYSTYSSSLITINGNTLFPAIALSSEKHELEEVEVVAKKPYLERQPGKLILNVENSINATGSSAFELLEKAPAVTINSSDVITLSGKSGIVVQVDGKALPMSGTDLANYLRGIPSNAIEKIELITNPSSRYDAAGSAIINIKLKKDTRLGTNGTATIAYGQGVYPKAVSGVSLNHRTKKMNIYGSYNYAYRKIFNHLILERNFYHNDTFTGAYLQDNYLKFPTQNHTARFGIDYTINPKNSVGIVFSGVANGYNQDGFNSSDVLGPNGNMVSRFETGKTSRDRWFSGSVNLNYKHVLDTLGSEWTADVDYIAYGNTTRQLFTTRYFDLNGSEYLPAYLLYGDIKGGLNIYSVKTDVKKELGKGRTLETGLKTSYVVADNDLRFFDRSSGTDSYDSTKSNHFIYTENINAGYLNFAHIFGKWTYQLGLRVENTNVSGKQVVYNTVKDTSYIQLFPTAYLSYQLNDNNSLELSYSRRIDRPGYDQLNPFKFYLDPSTYQAGNPYLRPQTTHTVELAHLWKNKIYSQLGISRTLDNITETIGPSATEQNVTVQTEVNLDHVDLVYTNFSVPVDITKWWNSTNNINAYVALYSGTAANTLIRNQGSYAFNIQTTNTFTLKGSWTLEVNGSYRSRELYAFDSIQPIWTAGFGCQKKILKNRGIIRLNVTDLFYTNQTTARVRFTDYIERFVVNRETRVASLSFTYKFGNANVSPNRRRAGGADDLKSRVNNSGVG